MLKKTIKYTDFDGNERIEDHYFNLTQSELMEVLFSLPGEVKQDLSKPDMENFEQQAALKLIDRLGGDGVFNFVKSLMLKAYGVKSEDGKRFKKSEEISKEFQETLAFDTMFMELMRNEKAAADFVNGIIPANLLQNANTNNAQALLSKTN